MKFFLNSEGKLGTELETEADIVTASSLLLAIADVSVMPLKNVEPDSAAEAVVNVTRAGYWPHLALAVQLHSETLDTHLTGYLEREIDADRTLPKIMPGVLALAASLYEDNDDFRERVIERQAAYLERYMPGGGSNSLQVRTAVNILNDTQVNMSAQLYEILGAIDAN